LGGKLILSTRKAFAASLVSRIGTANYLTVNVVKLSCYANDNLMTCACDSRRAYSRIATFSSSKNYYFQRPNYIDWETAAEVSSLDGFVAQLRPMTSAISLRMSM
jgi:hypothetical protein